MSTEEPILNNGERLYYQDIAKGIIRQSKIEETKKNDEDNFTMEFHFQPHTNSKLENDKYSNIPSKFRESIPTQNSEEKNKNLKEKPKSEEEIKKMTNRLHSELKKFKEKKEKLCKDQTKEECPFTPTINVQGKADPKYFMMRLEKWNKKMEEKIKKNEGGKKNLNYDTMTGQKLFQPKVEDPMAKKIKRENEDVHTDLYKKGLEHIDYRKKIMKTDTREDLQKIENEKKEKINKLKEERDRYKKEKQEKFQKEIEERALKVKAEKENMEKIIKERISKENKEEEKKKQDKKDVKNIKNKGKGKEDKDLKDKKGKKLSAKTEEILVKSKNQNPKKEKSATKNLKNEKNIKNKPLSSKQRVNTEITKLKSTKETKETKNIVKKIPVKKENKNERAKSQSQKERKKAISKEKDAKIQITFAKDNKKIGGDAKRLKSIKTDKKNFIGNKNEKIGEIEYNIIKNNKKDNLKNNKVDAIEYNVVSMGGKPKAAKKGKIVKK